jgi:Domain of unknown function (DUF222)
MSELLSAIAALAAADSHATAAPALLVDTETLLAAQRQLDGLIARRLQAMDARDVSVHECGRHLRAWLAEEQGMSTDEAGRRVAVARALPFHPQLAAAMDAGDISHDHARVILSCLRKLVADWQVAAEPELIKVASEDGMAALIALCQAIRVRSGADEDAEAAAQRQYRDRWATLSTTFEQMVHLEAMLDPESGATLQAALAPMMVPTEADERDTAQRRADALTDLARFSLDHGDLSDHNGERPQVMITLSWAELRDGIPPGQLSTATMNGTPITPATARRIACDANIIPAVLGGHSEVLDLGRSTPTWSRAQRRARRIEDNGCTWPKCQAGLDRCRIHHLTYLSHGGPTDLNNGTNLCTFHHWLVHHTAWTITRNSLGRIEVRRT